MKKIIYLTILILLINVLMVQGIEITKESPQEIKINEIIEIKINIFNSDSIEKEFTIEEILPKDIEIIEPTIVSTKRNDALEIKYYEWTTKISQNKIKTITYKIRPLSLGDYSIGSTQVIDNSDFNIYESNVINFKVKCISNNKCESNENIITCPEDCQAGSFDGICDYKADGICDPDCDEEPDCKKSEINFYYILIPSILLLIILLIWLLPKMINKNSKFL